MDTRDSATDDTTSPEWESIDALQNYLVKMLRKHEAGKGVSYEEVVTAVKKMLADQDQAKKEETAKVDIASGLIDYWAHVERRKETVSTGLAGLNEMLGGGLESQRLMVLLGAPGGGKTTLANQIAVHAADSGRPVLYVTSEDAPFNLLAKTIARQGGIHYTAVLKAIEAERKYIEKALQDYRASFAGQRLHYFDATLQVDMGMIKDSAQALFEQYKADGTGILVIDYLQRLARALPAYRNGNKDLRQAVTMLTEELRQVASGLDCCVLCLASQNRASGYGAGSNSLSSAKESGDIEYTADVMMSLGEDEQRLCAQTWLKPKILKLDKNRQGGQGTLALDWYPDRQQFTPAPEDSSYTASGNGNGTGRKGKRS